MEFSGWLGQLGAAMRDALASFQNYLPQLLGALAVLVVGFVLAKTVRYVVERFLRRATSLVSPRVLDAERDEGGGVIVRIAGRLAFWVVLLFAAGTAAEVLGFAALTGELGEFARYVPRLIAAVLVLLGGVVASNLAAGWIRGSARSAGIAYGESVARAARGTIILVASVVALTQAGIDSTLLVVAVATVLGAFLGAVALAFGLGARTTVANIIGAHYFQRSFKVNQRIRIGELEGRILEIQPTGVLLDTAEGVTLVPASLFSESTTLLVTDDPS